VRLVNAERAKKGLPALRDSSGDLQAAANKRAGEIARSYGHTRPNGKHWSTVLDEYGIEYYAWGENIAMGAKTPREVVALWMNSPGHRDNILSGDYTQLCVGMAESRGDLYWTQLFINEDYV